ncbi:ThuA domain-containing protein [Solwaraspora sp. WMMD1047]|uniref:ThuA domain-containing protein n=1 Tax=Solwaraspora sp. WMMD1047 TaxID=3016102 RepID=UPI0024178816|nr:ThuA domain-containing protein [Solwaraspora sp. WMMD1047]MDG4830515.1 ThuA domain-containing protein [Solwaraspora sp. WMMD1047]
MAARFDVLVFSRTTGFRHDSIPAGIEAVREIGAAAGFGVDATEHPAALAGGGLARYRVLVFLNTNGTVLDPPGRRAVEAYVRGGGGFVGVHSAAATEYDWPFYGRLVGAYFDRHPDVQPAVVRVADPDHPATAGLPARWRRTDEWYDFRAAPAAGTRVLLTVDESTYRGGGMGAEHAIAWCHESLGGRAFYTGLGHTVAGYSDPDFRAHLAGGIRWVVRPG